MDLFFRCAGGMVAGGHADDPVHTNAGGDQERPDGGDAHGPKGVAAAHPERASVRSRVLHVPDKHGPDDQSDRVPGRGR